MNLVTKEEYTNMYIRAAQVRSVLHDVFINNKYGFTSLFIKTFKSYDGKPFKIVDYPVEYVLEPYDGMPTELKFNYSLKDNGLSTSIDVRNIYAIMHVDVLQTFVAVLVGCINYLYNSNVKKHLFDDPEQLDFIHDFLQDASKNTRSSVTMLCDINVYLDHFIIVI